MEWNPYHEAIKALFSVAGAALVLLLSWGVGNKLAFSWNVKQKRREFQLTASQQFYTAYGEFFATWKLWNKLNRQASDYAACRWELHKRAASAEAVVEGMLVKLSSELSLSSTEVESLGRYRQGFQRLRESIRDDKLLPWDNSEHPEYKAFKDLSIQVAHLLAKDWPTSSPTVETAAAHFVQITSNVWKGIWLTQAGHSGPPDPERPDPTGPDA
jgi:hypothetical protein